MLSDERYEWKDEELHYFLSQFIPHVISCDDNKKIFNFSHDMVKEAVYSQVENVGEAREKILEVLGEILEEIIRKENLEEMDEELSDEKKAFVTEEIFYQADEIINCKERDERLMSIAFISSKILTEYGARRKIPLLSYEYGKKALYYAEKLELWFEALEIAIHVLVHTYELLIPEEEARTLYNKVDGVFSKAIKLNEDWARYRYAFAMKYWVFYVLYSLNNPKEAASFLKKAFNEVGSKDSRKIKDEFLWYNAYVALLETKSYLFSYKENFKKALKVRKKEEELLEEYFKDNIINRVGRKKPTKINLYLEMIL